MTNVHRCNCCSQLLINYPYTTCPSCIQSALRRPNGVLLPMTVCASCRINPPNPGHAWCQPCYQVQQMRRQVNHAQQVNGQVPIRAHVHVSAPARPHVHFTASPVAPRMGSVCTACGIAAANPGRPWCQACYVKAQTTNTCKNCERRSAVVGKDLCIHCYNPQQGTPLCQICKLHKVCRAAKYTPAVRTFSPGCWQHQQQAYQAGFRHPA